MGEGSAEGGQKIGLIRGLADDGKRILNAVDVLEPEEMGGGLEEGSVVIRPGRKAVGFRISVLGDLKTHSFFDLKNVTKSGSKRDLKIDAK